ncbi:sugar phosphate nucleotidyltransferase [Paracoccus zeaxanthinifaciens]|uniref:sugar phosphate nucleotidyltransferase n=1 Tax=Paracoccus zeaxanthinifaciens TaxID=187400 RepID=UPI000429C87D|nr:sugar phosphate nucleotidyltransferase [Paracoccus zeaxanthinifaciens]
MSITHRMPAATGYSVATILLAGGKGTRLADLTATEAKPAIHFAGRNRIVDFTMANCVRSGIGRMIVATQFAPATLHDHLPARWGAHFAPNGLSIADGRGAYAGTADAVRRNWDAIEASGASHVLVLAADHVYEMDYRPMIEAHVASGAAVTLAADVVDQAQASGFGVMHADRQGRILSFLEKPEFPPSIPDEPGRALVSMGIYVFDKAWLADAMRDGTATDFGHDLVPLAVDRAEAMSYRLPAGRGGRSYWRDVGTLQALRLAQLDFLRDPPARLPFPSAVGDWYLGNDSVAMPGATVHPHARLTRCIVAPGCHVPADLVAGEDPSEDARWFRQSGDTLLITPAMLRRRDALRPRPAHVLRGMRRHA